MIDVAKTVAHVPTRDNIIEQARLVSILRRKPLTSDVSQKLAEMLLVNKKIEEAIKFLVQSNPVSPSGKPVILHSLRIAFYLMNEGYDSKIVLAAVLHDVLEDADANLETITEKFGKNVAELVLACSFDQSISDETERYEESFKRATKYGAEALVLKAADILDNSYYLSLADYSRQKWLLEKTKHFLNISENQIGHSKVYKVLQRQHSSEQRRLKKQKEIL